MRSPISVVDMEAEDRRLSRQLSFMLVLLCKDAALEKARAVPDDSNGFAILDHGFQSEALLPTSRGYDTYRGYLQGTSRLSSRLPAAAGR